MINPFDLSIVPPIALDEIDKRFLTKRTDRTNSTPNDSYRGASIGGGNVEDVEDLEDLQPLCHAVFSTLLIRKMRFYAMVTKENSAVLVNSTNQGQQECVKRKMKHAEYVPYLRTLEYFDQMGDRAV